MIRRPFKTVDEASAYLKYVVEICQEDKITGIWDLKKAKTDLREYSSQRGIETKALDILDKFCFKFFKTEKGSLGSLSSVPEGGYSLSIYSHEDINREKIFPRRGDVGNEFFDDILHDIHVFKPVKPITLEEAKTIEGFMAIEEYYGTLWKYREESEIRKAYENGENMLPVVEEELSPINIERILRAIGRPRAIEGPEDYRRAIEEITGSPYQKLDDIYLSSQGMDFARFVFYEFMRTENYPTMKDLLARHEEYGLPPEWEKSFCNVSAETVMLLSYLSSDKGMKSGEDSIQDIANFIHAPMSVIIRAMNTERKDRIRI